MNENGINIGEEIIEENSEISSDDIVVDDPELSSEEIIETSEEIVEYLEESSSVSSGEGGLFDSGDSPAGAESSGSAPEEVLDETSEGEGDLLQSSDDVTDMGLDEVQENVEGTDMVAVVEQLEAQNVLLEEQNVLLESQVMLLSMIIFILMFNVCDRFISRIWSSIRSMGGSK